MLAQRSDAGSNMKFLIYRLIAITLLISCYYSSSIASYSLLIPSSYDSAQQVKAQKITTITKFTSHSNNNFITYKDPIYGLAIQYPSNWDKIEYYNTPLAASGSNLIVNFLAPLVNTSDHWRAHLMIQVLREDQAKKLIPQSQITIGYRQGFKSVYNSSMQIFNLDRNSESTVHIKIFDAWVTSSNGDTYLLTYKAAAAKYQDYMPTVQKMIDSFRIENSTVVNTTL
jgi:hypothetical protein